MKRLISLLLLLTICACLCACGPGGTQSTDPEGTDPDDTAGQETEDSTHATAVPGATTLNVMSFNVYSKDTNSASVADGEDTDMRIKLRAPKLNDILLGENIDIAGLQEVSAGWQNWLELALDSAYGYVGTCTENTHEGGYIVYRKDKLTVIEDGVFWLADGAPATSAVGWDAKYDRLCSWALFQVNETGEYLLFMDTHLDHQGTLARAYSSKLIVEQMQSLRSAVENRYNVANCPVILTGDMNAEPKSTAYRNFTDTLVDAFHAAAKNPFEEDASTSPGLYVRSSEDAYIIDGHRIDYVFVTAENVTVSTYNMIHTATNISPYGAFISDHNAIVVQLTIEN